MPAIANALVTAIPNVSGYPTVSGYTDSKGQVTLVLASHITYTLKFSGPAVGKIVNFKPLNASFTLYSLQNTGKASFLVSDESLQPARAVYAAPGVYKLRIPSPPPGVRASWQPRGYFVLGSQVRFAVSSSFSMVNSNRGVSATICESDHRVYINGGYNGSRYLAALSTFYPVTSAYTTLAAAPVGRSAALGTGLATKFYVADGYNGAYLADTYAYDPVTNTWSGEAGDLTAREYTAGGVINSRWYVVGGYNGSRALQGNHAYDPATNTWSSRAGDTIARYQAAGAVSGSTLFIIFGKSNGGAALSVNHAYDPATNTWSAKAPSGNARYGCAGAYFPIVGEIWVADGYNGSRGTEAIFAYDAATNTWTTKGFHDFTLRYDINAFAIGCAFYTAFGFNHNGSTSSYLIRGYQAWFNRSRFFAEGLVYPNKVLPATGVL